MQNQQTNSSKRNSNNSKTASNLGAAAYKGSERTEARGESEDTGVETGSPRSSRSEGEQKSIGTVIAQGLTKDTQESIDRVMDTAGKAIFWKEKDVIRGELQRWTPDALATALSRLAEAERQVKAPGYPGSALVEEEVLAIARFAARRR